MIQISVIIPVFNGEHYIAEAIDSVIAQTTPPLEIIVIDDGSTDRTQEIVTAASCPFPLVYRRQENQGQPVALNQGASMARGHWLAFLDADDLWYPDKLAIVGEHIAQNPTVPFFYSAMECMDETGRTIPSPKWISKSDPLFANRPFAFPSTVVLKKDVFMDAGGFDPRLRLLNDWELFGRLAHAHPVQQIPQRLVKYRRHPSQTSKAIQLWLESWPCYYESAARLWRDDPVKHNILKQRAAAIYADLGKQCLRKGDYGQARQLFSQSFSLHHWSWRNLRRWTLSYLPGLREWYRYRKTAPEGIAELSHVDVINEKEDRLMLRPVTIVTVTYDTYFFVRLLIEKVREFVGPRHYEIIVVDRGSRDGSRAWLRAQPDVTLITSWQWRRSRHSHGLAAEKGVRRARHDYVVLLDSDAHPVDPAWLEKTVDLLDDRCRLAGAEHKEAHAGNVYGSYIHPFFMAFRKVDFGRYIVLRKMRGHDTDTGEEATIRLRDAGFSILGYPIEFCPRFSIGHPKHPQVSAGVFHAGHATRLGKNTLSVLRETGGIITTDSYIEPLKALLRTAYRLDY